MKKYILGGIAAVLIVIGCMWVAKGHNCKKENTAVAVSATDDNSQFVTLTDVVPAQVSALTVTNSPLRF